MFRAVPCSYSGGQIVLLLHLLSSLSVNDCTVHRLRALNRRTVQPFTESDDNRCCNNTVDLLKMRMVMLETCLGL